MILVDTVVWSMALRRAAGKLSSQERGQRMHLEDLLNAGQAAVIGPIRQEILTGVRSRSQFEELRLRLAAIPELPLNVSTFDTAADCANRCAARGIAVDDFDMLICAAALENAVSIWTFDADFERYAGALGLPPLYPTAT